MATFAETRVDVGIVLTRTRDGSDHVMLTVRTLDDVSGLQIRRVRQDITSKMSAARMTGIAALLNDALTYVKAELDLPPDVVVGPSE